MACDGLAVKSGSPTLMLMTSMPSRRMAAACLTISMTRKGSIRSTRDATCIARVASTLGFWVSGIPSS
jgi:hypothetical protein